MAKKSVTLIGLVRRVRKQLFDLSIPAGREDAIETIMDARPDWTYEEAERLYEWMDEKEMYTSNWIADAFCETHRHPYGVCIDQHNRKPQTDATSSVVLAAATTTTAAPIETAIEANAKKQEAKRQARIAADVAVKEAEEEKHLPGKRPVLEAIFGRDFQEVVTAKLKEGVEGWKWIQARISEWQEKNDAIHAHNYLNSMEGMMFLLQEFPNGD